MKIFKFILVIFGIFLFIGIMQSAFRGCGSSFRTNPVDKYIKDLEDEEQYTILLKDMNVEGSFFKTYKHKYQIVVDKNGEPQKTETQWQEVGEKYFKKHIDHLGMELVSKDPEQGLQKQVAPPGYSNYVGNSQYGEWQTRNDGTSFWAFYGQYAMLSTMFDLGGRPIRRSYYNDYQQHRRSGKVYRGPKVGGNRLYGSGSRFTRNKSFGNTWSSKASNRSFRQKVRNRVSRSSGRYGSSSFRSRSSGFGK